MRREHRRKEALRWSVADGRVVNFRIEDGFMGSSRVKLQYSYRVYGEDYTGTVTGVSMRDSQINQIGDALTAISSLQIRYDPENSARKSSA